MARKLSGIPKEQFYINLEHVGNTTSSTVPLCLVDCIDSGAIVPGKRAMIAGFGLGYSWGATVLEF